MEMLEVNQIKQELIERFPQYSFFMTRRLTGRCIVAKKSQYYGADIFVKKDRIVVQAAVPHWLTRIKLGAGAVYLKLTDIKFNETALEIKKFLAAKYEVSLRK